MCSSDLVAMVKYRDKAPTNALIAQSVRVCAERRIRYLAYQNFPHRKQVSDTLTNFKEVNGFQRMELPRYYVPLTALGSLVLRLGLLHSIVDHLPVPVVNKLRKFRTAWHMRKSASVT